MAGVNKVLLDMNQIQIESFWSKVDITDSDKDCWNWKGAKKPKGYGNVRINSKYMLAHRVAFELANGSIPKGFIVCHICDNPSCCNPNHLMLGTTKSNSVDMLIKNRQKKSQVSTRGMNNVNSKLNDDKVRVIRSEYKKSASIKMLADLYEVSPQAIRSVINNETWRHVE